ncbi:hypothetical protein ABRY23_01345 [Melioribacteraceae bacterium 4301-Me]|uniref:hypothetical protein n=1 Tax=Pyranulibacter aquaticus TaxID=3163344 RepID=UPI00359A0F25
MDKNKTLILAIKLCILFFFLIINFYFVQYLFPKSSFKSTYSDSIQSGIPIFTSTRQKNEAPNYREDSLGKYVPITGNTGQLKYFFDALKQTSKKRIRIGYYGDSIILGDVISEYLRDFLQEKFGGKGIGFVPIISEDIKMRQSVYHEFSNDWNSASIVKRNPNNLPLGISGNVAVPNLGSWVKYQTTNYLASTQVFYMARLFYSNADESSIIEYSVNNQKPVRLNLTKSDLVNSLDINSNSSITSLLIKFISGEKPYIYGVSLESANGIYVDNFAMPGNSGVSLLDINDKILSEFSQIMNYKLLVFNYGANVTSPNKGIYTLYENKMVEVINKYKKLFPQCSIILISVEDKTMKIGSNFVTNPDVPLLLKSQKRIAERTNIAFWNLWEAMGGENSMYKWVNSSPPLALRDYAHFTPEGGKKVADLFFKSLMDAYSNYKNK